MPDRGRRHLLLSDPARGTADGGAADRRQAVARATMVPWHSRSPLSGPTPPCSTCRGRPRWSSGRRTSSPRCPAGSPGTSSGSSRCRVASSRSRRSRTTWPGASTTCCGCCRSWTSPASSRSVSSAAGRPPTARSSTPAWSRGTCSSRCPTGRCSARRCAPTPPSGCIDALAVLLVRLHLTGFWWGDCSLSNTLFRRDAGAFAAYLVDAETGEIRDRLSDGQREHDLDIARVNIAGELMDLAAGGFLDEVVDPVEISQLSRRALPLALARADRARALRARRPVAGRGAHPAPQRPRLRRRRAGHLHRHRRLDHPDPAQGRRRGPPLAPAAAADRPGRRGEPGAPAAQRPRRLRRRPGPPERRRGARRPRLAGPRLRAGRPGRAAGAAPASSSRPSCSTRCSSTGGTCPSGPGTTFPSPMRSRTTSPPCCPASPTRRRSSASTRSRCRSWRCSPRVTGRANDRPVGRFYP